VCLTRVQYTVLTIVQDSYEVTSPEATRPLKLHSPPYTPTYVSYQSPVPTKLTFQPANQHLSNGRYQPNCSSPTTTPDSPHQITITRQARVPYSESRGELQRQFATTQRLLEHHSGSANLAESGAYPSEVPRLSNANDRARRFRLHAEKLLQSFSARRVRRSSGRSAAYPEKQKKVRFAAAVECFEF
jgi:hypothetical protein